jgi:hypothetical protein
LAKSFIYAFFFIFTNLLKFRNIFSFIRLFYAQNWSREVLDFFVGIWLRTFGIRRVADFKALTFQFITKLCAKIQPLKLALKPLLFLYRVTCWLFYFSVLLIALARHTLLQFWIERRL